MGKTKSMNSDKTSTQKEQLKYQNCIVFNARSLKSIHKREALFKLLSKNKHKIVNVTETWEDDSISNSMLLSRPASLECVDYSVFTKRRFIDKECGGVAIFVHNSLNACVVATPTKYEYLEVITVDLISKTRPYARNICVYRPPDDDAQAVEWAELLGEYINLMCNVSYSVFVCGDFNLPHVNWETLSCKSRIEQIFLDCFQYNSLFQHVREPTHVKNNILDLVLSSNNCHVIDLSLAKPFLGSDHYKLKFKTLLGNSVETVKSREVICWKNIDLPGASHFLSTLNWDKLFENCVSTDDFYLIFSDVMQAIIKVYIPKRVIKPNRFSLPQKLRKLRADRNRLWREKDSMEDGRAKFNKCCKTLARETKLYVAKREEKIVLSKDKNHFYSYAKSKLNSKQGIAPLMNQQGVLTTDDFQKTNVLNDYFSSVFTLDDGRDINAISVTDSSLSHVNFEAFEVCKVLRGLPNKTSRTPDKIPAFLLKQLALYCSKHEFCSNCICYPLSKIFRVSFATGKLPSDWLSADIFPIFKKGDASSAQNYRPVALTSVSCKAMQIIIRDSMIKYLRENELLQPEQHGFLNKRSVSTQLLGSIQSWIKSLSLKKSVDIVYTDFSRAFDAVPHRKLIEKLKCFGFRSYLIEWISAFLSNRTQRVIIGDQASGSKAVISGVIQGSCIGPILYVLYSLDIPRVVRCKSVEVGMYADDVKMSSEVPEGKAALSDCAGKMFEWGNTHQIVLSIPKCLVLHVGENNPCEDYVINGIKLASVEIMRDLGIHIARDLSFSQHCNIVSSKAMKILGMTFRAFCIKNPSVLVRAYVTYVRPILEFGTEVWSPFSHKDVIKVERVQRKFTEKVFRRCFNPEAYCEYEDRCKFLKLDSLEYRRIICDLCMCYKIINGLVDLKFEDFFIDGNNRNRGNGSKLYVKPYIQEEFSTKDSNLFANRVVNVWNSLSQEKVQCNSLSQFRKNLLLCKPDLIKYLLEHNF